MLILPEGQRQLTDSIRLQLAKTQLLVLIPMAYFLPTVFLALLIFSPCWIIIRLHYKKPTSLPRFILISLTLFIAILIYLYHGTYLGKDAGVTLICAMYSLKVLESRKYRDLNLLLTLSFFILAMSFLFSQAMFMIVYMFGGYAYIVHSLMIANGLPHHKISWKKSVSLVGVTAPLMIFLFLFFPRLPGPLWNMPGQLYAGTGVSDSMSPGDIGNLNLLDDPAFRVKLSKSKQDISSSQMYWRGLVLEDYNGISWTRARRTSDSKVEVISDPERYISAEITLEPTRQRWLFGLEKPVSLPFGLPLNFDGTFSSQRKIGERIRYKVDSDPMAILEPQLSAQSREVNTFLPEDFNERSKQWAREQYNAIQNHEKFVQFLLEWINKQPYFYTLRPPIMLENMVDDFWFEQQRGFCEHYASSLVFMLRAAGVPSRIVTGYQGGEYNRLGDYWLIRQNDAHAWAEYWIKGKGWVRVDPTSAIAPFRIDDDLLSELGQRGFLFDEMPLLGLVQHDWFDDVKQWGDNINGLWRDWVIDFGQSRQLDFFDWIHLSSMDQRSIYFLLFSVFFTVLIILAWHLNRSRIQLDAVGSNYLKLLKKLEKRGFKKQPNEGAQTFLARVVREQPSWRGELVPVLRLYTIIRYSKSEESRDMIHKFGHLVSGLSLRKKGIASENAK